MPHPDGLTFEQQVHRLRRGHTVGVVYQGLTYHRHCLPRGAGIADRNLVCTHEEAMVCAGCTRLNVAGQAPTPLQRLYHGERKGKAVYCMRHGLIDGAGQPCACLSVSADPTMAGASGLTTDTQEPRR